MAALWVEVPYDPYEALRERARQHGKSTAQEVLCLLQESVPTADELQRRDELLEEVAHLQAAKPNTSPIFPSAEEMLRLDRER
jgi:plasmid stability protein